MMILREANKGGSDTYLTGLMSDSGSWFIGLAYKFEGNWNIGFYRLAKKEAKKMTGSDGWVDFDGLRLADQLKPETGVQVRFRSGEYRTGKAGDWDWRHDAVDPNGDIVAYKLVK